MNRFSAAVFSLVAILGLTATVPAGVNLHNGYIEVVNKGPDVLTFTVSHFIKGTMIHQRLQPGQVYIYNECCVLAGSTYSFSGEYLNWDGLKKEFIRKSTYTGGHFSPRLCNIHGIPFGYSYFAFSHGPSLSEHHLPDIQLSHADCPTP